MDQVFDSLGNQLYAGTPDEVKAYLQTPGNMGDTTRVTYGPDSPRAYEQVYASEYLSEFDAVYPNG